MSRRGFIRSVIAAVALSPVLCRMGEKVEAWSEDSETGALIRTTHQTVYASTPVHPEFGLSYSFSSFTIERSK